MASTIKSGSNNDLYIQTDGVDRIVVDSNGNTSIIGSVLSVENATGWGEAHLNGANGGDLILQDDGVNIGEVYAGVGHGMTVKSFAGHGINFITNNDTSKMTIDTAGRVTMPYQPHAQVYKSNGGNDTVAAGTTVVWNVVNSNIGNIYNVANGRFTVPVAGRYMVATVVMTGSINKYGIYNVRRNGNTTFPSGWAQGYNYGTANDKQIVFVGVVDLDANDYLDVYVNGSSSNNSLYWGGYNYMTVTLVG